MPASFPRRTASLTARCRLSVASVLLAGCRCCSRTYSGHMDILQKVIMSSMSCRAGTNTKPGKVLDFASTLRRWGHAARVTVPSVADERAVRPKDGKSTTFSDGPQHERHLAFGLHGRRFWGRTIAEELSGQASAGPAGNPVRNSTRPVRRRSHSTIGQEAWSCSDHQRRSVRSGACCGSWSAGQEATSEVTSRPAIRQSARR